MKRRLCSLLLGGCILVVVGAGAWNARFRFPKVRSSYAIGKTKSDVVSDLDACTIALLPHQGNKEIDRQIRSLQDEARSKSQPADVMKRLGWAFVTNARLSFDPGYYKLAEQCAICIRTKNGDDPDALLLQGHILQSLHRFKDAEPIARELVKVRSESCDYALLGDLLMEQGGLAEAIGAYQQMINLRPDLQSYTRVAHMRWLRGDLAGAIDVMHMAVTAGSPRDPEPTAWAYTRLGNYELQAGNSEIAARSANLALEFAQNYAAGLLLRGRILLAQGNCVEAIGSLQSAATRNPLPEYQWILADALREASRSGAAEDVEDQLMRNGAINDPRTLSLYLATRRQQIQRALELAQAELNTRADVFTLDALAWACKANGRLAEARDYSERSLREGTQDARLYYHAGSIALALDNYAYAGESFKRADTIKQTLIPSERDDLNTQFAALRELDKSLAITRGN
jgi:tetratricopeptide (TPR) repeat protein